MFNRGVLDLTGLPGWLFNPKFRYQITSWSVLSTNQTTLYGFAGFQFNQKFNVYAGATEQKSTSAVTSIQQLPVSCTGAATDDIPTDALATGGTSLRYDTTVRHVATGWASNGAWSWQTAVGGAPPALVNNHPLLLI